MIVVGQRLDHLHEWIGAFVHLVGENNLALLNSLPMRGSRSSRARRSIYSRLRMDATSHLLY